MAGREFVELMRGWPAGQLVGRLLELVMNEMKPEFDSLPLQLPSAEGPKSYLTFLCVC